MYEIPGYDAWKTACCEKYPDCSHCPYDEDDEEYLDEEDQEEEE